MRDATSRVSVVIASARPRSVCRALDALRWQRHRDFEVIVVEGPPVESVGSHDRLPADVRVERCPDANLSRARNIGLSAASGEIVAFIDDDAVPETAWLAELLAPYEDAAVSGAGGIVLGRDGWWPQYGYTTSDRLGRVRFNGEPPSSGQAAPGSDPFVFLQGCNMSFRRAALVELGGFDENLALFQDDVDICLRMIDAGKLLRSLADAPVHHLSFPNATRRADGVPEDPFARMTAFAYFVARHGSASHPSERVDAAIMKFAEDLRAGADAAVRARGLAADTYAHFCSRVLEGMNQGQQLALTSGHARRAFPLRKEFRPYETKARPISPLRICVLAGGSSGTYPESWGRAAELGARRLSELGHDVHLVAPSESGGRGVDFAGAVWRHRFQLRALESPDVDDPSRRDAISEMAATYHEVTHLHERAKVDLLFAPLEASVGLLCGLDPRLPVAIALQSTGTQRPGANQLAVNDAGQAAGLHLTSEDARPATIPSDIYREILAALRAQGLRATAVTRAGFAGEADLAPDEALAASLSTMLAARYALEPHAARRLTIEVLDRSLYPIDFRAAALAAWRDDDAHFVQGMFRLMLARDPDPLSLEHWLAHLASGGPRVDLARFLADADEAPARRAPPGLVEDVLAGLRAETPTRAATVAPSLGRPDRLDPERHGGGPQVPARTRTPSQVAAEGRGEPAGGRQSASPHVARNRSGHV